MGLAAIGRRRITLAAWTRGRQPPLTFDNPIHRKELNSFRRSGESYARSDLSSVDYHFRLARSMGSTIRQAMHPGTAVRHKCIEKNGLSVTHAAQILGVDRQTLSNLLNARSGISPEMAVRLEKAFGTSAREWLIQQVDYELAEVMRRAKKIKVEPFSVTDKQAAERQGDA